MFKTLGIAALALAILPFASMAADSGKLNPSGEKLYKSSCVACHSTGAANAPKLGNKKAWDPIIARGMDEMMSVAINGKGGMPARGGTKADDDALRAAVEYMVSRVR
ncbi:c-type cytochrome [Castellaniella sp. GW247-6E4]|uniref:c-type cytochrome n=1 Tax=Castellaniella sp. GW247-6E4 TaxID=3140380 RepID=UPI0033158BD1